MAKARFYIKGEKVQDIGYRPFIMKEILRRGGLNGIADNYKDSVEVLLEGDKDKIKKFYDYLKEEENIPKGAIIQEFTDLEFLDDNFYIPNASEYSQTLTFEQMGKGIPLLEKMGKSIDNAREEMGGMKEEMHGMREEMGGMKESIGDARKEMREGFKELPKEIAKELKEILK
jgi:acylphosphatase/uncharacterized protein YjbJ (UPF0337 family)